MGGDREKEEETCDIGLSLQLGSGGFTSRSTNEIKHKVSRVHLSLFPLNPKKEIVDDYHGENDGNRWNAKTVNQSDQEEHTRIVKRDNTNFSSNIDKYDHTSTRKKLRLTKEQANFLETSFKQHNTLNMMQKQELAERLDLQPRQVEVWFQNRRARTKLKKTEVDCEVLKKCVERLNEENIRLKKELHELRSAKLGPTPPSPFYPHHTPKNVAALIICGNCNKVSNKCNSEDKKHDNHTLFGGSANDKI